MLFTETVSDLGLESDTFVICCGSVGCLCLLFLYRNYGLKYQYITVYGIYVNVTFRKEGVD